MAVKSIKQTRNDVINAVVEWGQGWVHYADGTGQTPKPPTLRRLRDRLRTHERNVEMRARRSALGVR